MEGEKGRGREGGRWAGGRRVGLRTEKWICQSQSQEQPVPAQGSPAWSSASPACPEPINAAFVTQVQAPAPPPPPLGSSGPHIIWYPTQAGPRAGRQPLPLAPEATNNQLITAPLCGNNGGPKRSALPARERKSQDDDLPSPISWSA